MFLFFYSSILLFFYSSIILFFYSSILSRKCIEGGATINSNHKVASGAPPKCEFCPHQSTVSVCRFDPDSRIGVYFVVPRLSRSAILVALKAWRCHRAFHPRFSIHIVDFHGTGLCCHVSASLFRFLCLLIHSDGFSDSSSNHFVWVG